MQVEEKMAGVEVGSVSGSSHLSTCVSEASWLHDSSPVPVSPFQWNVPLALEAWGWWKFPVQEMLPFFKD